MPFRRLDSILGKTSWMRRRAVSSVSLLVKRARDTLLTASSWQHLPKHLACCSCSIGAPGFPISHSICFTKRASHRMHFALLKSKPSHRPFGNLSTFRRFEKHRSWEVWRKEKQQELLPPGQPGVRLG